MATETVIAWTHHTMNPWMGCTKISAGCAHCYAATLTKNRMGLDLWGPQAPRQITKSPWINARAWNRAASEAGERRRCFCGSLCDWAEDHPALPPARSRLWDLIRATPNLDWQLLTKRADRIAGCLPKDWGDGYPNVWLGTSIEDMHSAHRADNLRAIPAVVRFISYEPALGPLDDLDITGIDWVIYGGESGPGFRAENKDWARTMHRKCGATGAAFFHKQSAGYRTELGIELDGVLVRHYPTPRTICAQ